MATRTRQHAIDHKPRQNLMPRRYCPLRVQYMMLTFGKAYERALRPGKVFRRALTGSVSRHEHFDFKCYSFVQFQSNPRFIDKLTFRMSTWLVPTYRPTWEQAQGFCADTRSITVPPAKPYLLTGPCSPVRSPVLFRRRCTGDRRYCSGLADISFEGRQTRCC